MTEKTVVKKIHGDSILPKYGTPGAAGADVCAYLNSPDLRLVEYNSGRHIYPSQTPEGIRTVKIRPGNRVLIPTGLIIKPGKGLELQVRPRSGFPLKFGLLITNAPGTVDEDYTGEVCVGLVNVSADTVVIPHGERIAQVLLAPVMRITEENSLFLESDVPLESIVEPTERGAGGFGSTGR